MGYSLKVPGLEVLVEGVGEARRRVILVAGGRSPDPAWLRELYQPGDVLWAVDRGLDACFAAGLIPARMVGDFDSVSEAAFARAREMGIACDTFPPEKDLTDLQLALRIAREQLAPARVVLTGCWGGRFDHNFSNLYSPLGVRDREFEVDCMADERETLLFLSGPASVVLRSLDLPGVLSLLALTPLCRSVSVTGVRWELQDRDLSLFSPFAVSNRMNRGGETCRVAVAEGILGVYLSWAGKGLSK